MKPRNLILSLCLLTLLWSNFYASIDAQTLNKDIFNQRRQKLMEQMDGGIAIFKNTKIVYRNGDTEYPYRSNSDFYYLTGFDYPEAAFIILPNEDKKFIMFVQPESPFTLLWKGDIHGVDEITDVYGADTTFAIDQFDDVMRGYLRGKDRIYFNIKDKELYDKIHSLLYASPKEMIDINQYVHEMRIFKDAEEIKLLRKAIDITCDGLAEVMKAAEPDMYEYELDAILDYVFRKSGSPRKGFPSIVASGPNSTVFHYDKNDRQIKSGDIIVMDVGAEYGYYTADVTRTLPISGKFTKEQKELYEIALQAQLATIEMMAPGNKCFEGFQRAEEVIKEGLYRLGLITDKNSTWQYKAYYFPYISHGLGLDVHDVGDYGGFREGGRKLEPGMVLTIEPGLYVGENMIDVFRLNARRSVAEDEIEGFLQQVKPAIEKYKNIGIRIEDDVLITEQGNEVLSAKAPKTVTEIENLMAKRSYLNR